MNPVVSFLKKVWADMNTNGGGWSKGNEMKKITRLIILGGGLYVLLEMNPFLTLIKKVWADFNGGGWLTSFLRKNDDGENPTTFYIAPRLAK